MAELVASMVVGPLLSLVKEKASSYLLDQYKVMEGMEEQHKILKRKLPAILDVITDAEEKATHREGVKAWLEEVKTVAYEANEAFDEFNYEALRREAKEKGHIRKLGLHAVKLFPTHNRVAFRKRMGNKLQRIVQTIEVLVAEMNAFGFNYQHQALASKQWRQTASIIVDPKNIASESRAKEMRLMVKMLIDNGSNADLMVLPIFGMGGMGKTTLAQLIYNDPDIQKHFQQLLKWVCVSDDFDVCSLANKICESSDDKNLEKALQKLQKELTGKRYLLVLDDVWNEDVNKWEKLKASLKSGGVGSAILITTRNKGIAEFMGTVKPHNIAHLDNGFIKKIIETKAFNSEEKSAELVDLVDRIVERCAGSPLAANALGSVLRGKTSSKEWNAVLSKSIAHNKEDQILPILKLSYDDLPSHMKQCFAFCAVFPKDYEMDVESLIQLWMANGFIPEEKDVGLEITGKKIFNEMASRSFFQDVKQVIDEDRYGSWYYSRSTCKIHDLMHDVALSVMCKEVATITEKPKQSEFPQNTCRHLLLSCTKPEAVLNDSLKIRSPAIQTLLCDRYIESSSSLQHLAKCSSLRALELCQGKSTFLLKPKQLHHLRYLDVSYSDIEALPEDISILYNLHTLNVSNCYKLGRLPKGIKYMTALRHLYTHRCEKLKCMPPELGQLTSLQTLTNFIVGTGSDCSSIGELQALNNLGGPLLISQLENVTQAADAKQANLENKKEIRELSLTWTSSEEKQHCHKVLEGLKAPAGLEALKIKYYQGTSFPTWMGTLPNLVELHLYSCNKSNKLPPFMSARALQVLRLEILDKLECLCSGGKFFDFPNMKKLTLERLPEFNRWSEVNWAQGEQVIFPQLEELYIRNCGKLTTLLGGSYGGVYKEADEMKIWWPFPVLKVLKLQSLAKFQRWGAAEATHGQQIIFPQLERLSICNCKELTTLPEGHEVGAVLKVLNSEDLELGTTLCGGDQGKACSAFPALKVLELRDLRSFQRWGAPEAAQGQEIIFPGLENLSIWQCQKLIALPEGPLLCELRGGDYEKARSAFPALKVLQLSGLDNFQSWEEVKATQRGYTMFPHLEELSIEHCTNLAALPSPTSPEASFDHSNVTAWSAFPNIKKLLLDNLQSLESLGMTEATHGGQQRIPHIETLWVKKCPKLTAVPETMEAPKLSVLAINASQLTARIVPRFISSLSKLELSVEDTETTLPTVHSAFKLVDANSKSPLTVLELRGCNFLFSSSPLAVWTCFVQLQDLSIERCGHPLVCWPEKEFQSLVSLRHLHISECSDLSGYAKPAPGKPISERSQLLPKLESLVIRNCASLVEVFNLPASLKTMDVRDCPQLESIFGEKQDEPTLNQGASADGVASTAVPKQSSSATDHFLPCLESLTIYRCRRLSQVLNLAPSLREIDILGCDKLQLLSGQLDALQKLDIWYCPVLRSLDSCLVEFSKLERLSLRECKSLVVSFPDGPQAYSSLGCLQITSCPGIKSLPSSLKKRLDSLDDDDKELDARYEGAKLLKPKTWKYAVNL